MPDREKVIRAVDSCFDYWLDQHRYIHPLELEHVRQIKADAIELLKEQEAVVPYSMNAERTYGICPKCGKIVFRYGNVEENHYCGVCGQAVKWE